MFLLLYVSTNKQTDSNILFYGKEVPILLPLIERDKLDIRLLFI